MTEAGRSERPRHLLRFPARVSKQMWADVCLKTCPRPEGLTGQAAASSSSRHALTLAEPFTQGRFGLFLPHLICPPVDGHQPGGQFWSAALPDVQCGGRAQQAQGLNLPRR